MLKEALSASSAAYYGLEYRGGTLFAMKYQPPQQQPMLVALPSADDPASARVIFDPNGSSAKGSIAVDFYVPSLDGKFVAAALSENGSEDSSAHVFEVATGKELSDVVPRVNFATAGGSLEWKADTPVSTTPAIPRATNARRKTPISTSRFTFTGWGAIASRTRMSSARNFPASPKSSCTRAMMGSG